jgi:hypothetical protein
MFFCFPALGRLLSLHFLVLDIDKILACALPLWIQNQTLIVFCL